MRNDPRYNNSLRLRPGLANSVLASMWVYTSGNGATIRDKSPGYLSETETDRKAIEES